MTSTLSVSPTTINHQSFSPSSSSSSSSSSRLSLSSPSSSSSALSSNNYHSSITTNMIAGAVALSTAFTIMHPIDTIKTFMQSGIKHSPSSPSISSSFSYNHSIRPLLRGVLVSAAGAAPQGGIRLSTYEYTKELIRYSIHYNPNTSSPSVIIASSAAAAICGDIASCAVKLPREVIVNRMQLNTNNNNKINNNNFSSICLSIAKEEGLRGFYRGFLSTSCRDIPFMVLLFTCYENMRIISQNIIKKSIQVEEELVHVAEELTHSHIDLHHNNNNNINSTINNTVCQPGSLCSSLFGGISGSIAGFFTTPFDVIKTRLLIMSRADSNNNNNNNNNRIKQIKMRDAVYNIMEDARNKYYQQNNNNNTSTTIKYRSLRSYQFQSFFIGAVPRSAWWFSVCAMFFPIYENMKGIINNK